MEVNVMEVYGDIRTVSAMRAYKERSVPAELVLRIVEAARLTAGSMNGQSWHFIIVEDSNTLSKLGALARSGPYSLKLRWRLMSPWKKLPLRGFRCGPRHSIEDPNGLVRRRWIKLSWLRESSELKRLFGIPNIIYVLAILPFGHAA